MKYILMDTNIFIDMMVGRERRINSELIKSFVKLLDFDEIRLVVPQIVKYETNKHMEDELEQVGRNIDNVIKKIDGLYGINGYSDEGFDIAEYKEKSVKPLNDAKNMFETKKALCLKQIKKLMDEVFEHSNTIIIDDDEKLLSLCMRRKVYKKAPFHIENKESNADGLIAETLIHLKDYIEKIDQQDNVIYFVTGNHKDFSQSSKEKDKLHSHIIEDLEKEGIANRVKYVRQFNKLIGVNMKDEVKNANLKEEFEREFEEEENERKADYWREMEDLEREAGGLSSLSSIEDNFEDNFRESSYAERIVSCFTRINECYEQLENFYIFYDEELSNYLQGSSICVISRELEKWNKIMAEDGETEVDETVEGIMEISDWIEKLKNSTCYYSSGEALPEEMEICETDVTIKGTESVPYELVMDEFFLNPSSGGSDTIDIYVKKNGDILVHGKIELVYGFIEYDEDGGIGDACSDDINYNTQEVEEYIEQIANALEEKVSKHQCIVDMCTQNFDF